MILKIFFMLFSITSSTFANNCPHLEGSYLCLQNSYRTDTLYHFSQTYHQQDWIYSIIAQPLGSPPVSHFEVTADGIERQLIDLISGQKLIAKASCENTSLKVVGTAQAPNGVTIHFMEILQLTTTGDLSNVSLDINGQLVQEVCRRH